MNGREIINTIKPRKNTPVSLLSEMVAVLGYKIVVVPADWKIPESGFEITGRKGEDLDSLPE